MIKNINRSWLRISYHSKSSLSTKSYLLYIIKSYQSIDLSTYSGNDEINFFTVFQYNAYQACKTDSIPIYLVLHHRLSINKFLNKYGLKKNTGIVVGNYYSLANNHSMKQSPRYWLNRNCQNCIICLVEKNIK